MYANMHTLTLYGRHAAAIFVPLWYHAERILGKLAVWHLKIAGKLQPSHCCWSGSHKDTSYGLQSFFTDLKGLANVTGLNSGIYSALTASFVLAGLTYMGLPSQTLTAIFGSSAEKGLEDIFLWQLIGTAVSMAVGPVAFTQQVRQPDC